jgi:ribosome maturation factor RimP
LFATEGTAAAGKEEDMAGSADAIRELVEPALASSDLELWDVEVTRDTVRLLVDRAGGVDLDSLADLAGKVVSPLLDDHPELTPDGQYSLEVSSPGVERPLRRLEHYTRYLGAEISVKTTVPVDGARRHQGRLLAADGDGIALAVGDGPESRTVSIPLADIDRARAVLVWGPAPKPGRGQSGGSRKGHQKQVQAVKRPAADGRIPAATPVASREKDTES